MSSTSGMLKIGLVGQNMTSTNKTLGSKCSISLIFLLVPIKQVKKMAYMQQSVTEATRMFSVWLACKLAFQHG